MLCRIRILASLPRQPYLSRQFLKHTRHFASANPEDGKSIETKPAPNTLRPDSEIEVVKIEEAGNEAWSGVVQIDTGEQSLSPILLTSALIAGDATVFAIFAAIGRNAHGEGITAAGVLGTAFPFFVGWVVSALIVGGYGTEAKSGRVGSAASTAVKNWALGTPLGLVLHGLTVGHPPPLPFVGVTSVFTFVLMMTWRTAFGFAVPSQKNKNPGQTRSGNPFEFLSFLNSIVRRW